MDMLTKELTRLEPRGFSKLKIAVSRRIIKRAVQKLEQSKSDLLAAFMLYEIACRRDEARLSAQEQQNIIRQAVEEALASNPPVVQHTRTVRFEERRDVYGCRKSCHISGAPQSRAHFGSAQKSNNLTTQDVSFKLPLWLCEAAWVISFERAIGSWTFHLDRVDTIPRSHKAFCLCRKGGVVELKSMLDRRVVSLHSQDQDGNTLFRVALKHFQTDTAEFLLARGARIEAPQRSEYFDSDGFFHGAECKHADKAAMEVYTNRGLRCISFLTEACMLEDIILEPRAISATDCIPPTTSCWQRKHATERLNDIVIYLLNCMQSLRLPHVFAALDQEFFSLRTVGSCSLSFMHLLSAIWYIGPIEREAAHIGLASALLAHAIRVGADFHSMNDSGRTPFLTMVEHAVGVGIGREWEGTRIFDIVVNAWAALVGNQKIDLELYAAIERQRFREMYRAEEEEWWREDGIVGFSSGSQPKDWHVWPRHFGDVYCGVFWDLIEHPVRSQTMPCTYPEDGGLFAYLDECDQKVLHVRPRTSGLKAKTLRWIRSSASALQSKETAERRAAMERACLVALRNAKAWKTGALTDNDDMHHELLEEMANASLTRPDRIGLRASLWSLPCF